MSPRSFVSVANLQKSALLISSFSSKYLRQASSSKFTWKYKFYWRLDLQDALRTSSFAPPLPDRRTLLPDKKNCIAW